MLELMRRDWMLNRRTLVPMFLVFAALQLFVARLAADAPALPLFATCFWACLMTLVSFTREEQFRATSWSCTLPMTRAGLVRSRYVGSWLLVGGVVLTGLTLATLGSSGAAPAAPTFRAFLLDTPLLAAALITPFLGLLLPFVMRFGLRGAAVLLLPPNLALPVVFVVSKITGTQDSVEATVLSGAAAIALQVGRAKEAMPSPLFYLGVIGSLFFVNWLSYRLAVALFQRREL